MARRSAQREEFLQKEEEREVVRAQIYAINKLMRAKEEAQFAEFRLQREAEALGGGGDGGGDGGVEDGLNLGRLEEPRADDEELPAPSRRPKA